MGSCFTKTSSKAKLGNPLENVTARPQPPMDSIPSPPLKTVVQPSSTEMAVRERAKAAIIGAFVADAATMGLHWIYDRRKLESLLNDKEKPEAPEFFDPPSSPFYEYPSGRLSPYGAEVDAVLEATAGAGMVDGQQIVNQLYKNLSDFDGYVNSATKAVILNVKKGKGYPIAAVPDDQAHGMTKMPVVVARYAGLPELETKMREAIKSHQDHPQAEASGIGVGKILEKVVLGSSVKEALEWAATAEEVPTIVRSWLGSVSRQEGSAISDAVSSLGQSCHLPGSFGSPMYVLGHVDSYVDGVRANILAGGDQCSRAFIVGGMLAAQYGLDSIPHGWRKKTTNYSRIEELAERIVDSRPNDAL